MKKVLKVNQNSDKPQVKITEYDGKSVWILPKKHKEIDNGENTSSPQDRHADATS